MIFLCHAFNVCIIIFALFHFSLYFLSSLFLQNLHCWQFNSKLENSLIFCMTDIKMCHNDERWPPTELRTRKLSSKTTGNRKQPRMSFTSYLHLVIMKSGKATWTCRSEENVFAFLNCRQNSGEDNMQKESGRS